MEKSCGQCGMGFEVSEVDAGIYDRVSPIINGKKYNILLPELCADCRQQRRLAFRNEKTLYKRSCSLCRKSMVSLYDEGTEFPVYCQKCFWGDGWEALDFGKEYDFGKSFFEQFKELMKVVPRLALVNKQSQNSDYCNYSFQNKNCYLLFGSHYEEDCMYGGYSTKNKSCLDYFWTYESELCYECTFSGNCYKCVYADYCYDCSDCWFCFDLKGCRNCLFCHNLRNKQYCIFNKQYEKKEYEDYLRRVKLSSYKQFAEMVKRWVDYKKKNAIFRADYQTNCVDCEGNNLQNSKNLKYCFACTGCEDCAYGFQMDETYSSIDNSHMGYDKCELTYNAIGNNGVFHCLCCDSCWHDSDCFYCNLCFSSRDCFGSIGLRQKQYCILNKQYKREEYEEMLVRIMEQMKESGEWGVFFPFDLFPFAYNESIVQEWYPLSREEVLGKGWKWKEEAKGEPPHLDFEVPDDIGDVGDEICDKVLACNETGKSYKILVKELKLYRIIGVPVPRLCFEQRHRKRIDSRNPFKLWERTCDKCGAGVKTSFASDREERIYCEKCYLGEVY